MRNWQKAEIFMRTKIYKVGVSVPKLFFSNLVEFSKFLALKELEAFIEDLLAQVLINFTMPTANWLIWLHKRALSGKGQSGKY